MMRIDPLIIHMEVSIAMNEQTITRILNETAYVRTGGSPEELKAAKYIQAECTKFGAEAVIEAFEVNMANIQTATLTADGQNIPSKVTFAPGVLQLKHLFII